MVKLLAAFQHGFRAIEATVIDLLDPLFSLVQWISFLLPWIDSDVPPPAG
jgi:hypothetical protein